MLFDRRYRVRAIRGRHVEDGGAARAFVLLRDHVAIFGEVRALRHERDLLVRDGCDVSCRIDAACSVRKSSVHTRLLLDRHTPLRVFEVSRVLRVFPGHAPRERRLLGFTPRLVGQKDQLAARIEGVPRRSRTPEAVEVEVDGPRRNVAVLLTMELAGVHSGHAIREDFAGPGRNDQKPWPQPPKLPQLP